MAHRVAVNLITGSALNAQSLLTELQVRATANSMKGAKVPLAITQVGPDSPWHVYGQVDFPDFFKAHGFYDSVQTMWATIPFLSMVNALSKVTLNDAPGHLEPSNQALR